MPPAPVMAVAWPTVPGVVAVGGCVVVMCSTAGSPVLPWRVPLMLIEGVVTLTGVMAAGVGAEAWASRIGAVVITCGAGLGAGLTNGAVAGPGDGVGGA